MRVSNLRRSLVLSLACALLAPAWPYLASAAADEKDKQKAGPTEKVTLQYLIALDAIAPSKFVALIDGGNLTPSSHSTPRFSELGVQHDLFQIGVVEIGRRSKRRIRP